MKLEKAIVNLAKNLAKIDFRIKGGKNMVLQFSQLPEFSLCSKKIFLPSERHVTRLVEHSVLILMLEGTLYFREDGEDCAVSAGEYYIQRKGLFQEGRCPSPGAVYYFIHFAGCFSEGQEGLVLRGQFSPLKLLPTLERLAALSADRTVDPFRLNSYLFRILSDLLSANPHYDEVGGVAYRLKQYIETQYAEPICLEALSQRFGYTKDYLIRIFRERYGTTPHRYLTDCRMAQALWLLENTELSAEQIGAAVGYSDFSTFYRAFCKKHGRSPGKRADQVT